VDTEKGKLNWEADGKIDDKYVSSTELGGEAAAARMDSPGMTDTIRCTYFVATGFMAVYSDARRRKICPRLWDFNQPDSSVRD
jgi:hypothetical protein